MSSRKRNARYRTMPHIRGASLYDGDVRVAVGPMPTIERIAESLNSNHCLDTTAFLAMQGLSGATERGDTAAESGL